MKTPAAPDGLRALGLQQVEKLAALGQLAAGVAHEINNPMGYIQSNLAVLQDYVASLLDMLERYQLAEADLRTPATAAALRAQREAIGLDYLRGDIRALMGEAAEGIGRVCQIVHDLKAFSRSDAEQDWQLVDLHPGIDSTLNIARNEFKYRAEIVRDYGQLPPVRCLPSQIYQVVMNLVVNAAHAIGEQRGRITVRTRPAQDHVWLAVSDTGSGIAPEVLPRIFDPFFTTKPVGQGTGLGLSMAHGIVQRHGGRIEVDTAPGQGSTFRVLLPLRQPPGAQP